MESVDVVVVGGGLAGWTAAARARARGRSVVLLERSDRLPGWGNSVVSGGVLHAAMLSPLDPADALLERLVDQTDGVTDRAVATSWSANAAATVRWIERNGGCLVTDGSEPYRSRVFSPIRRTTPGLAGAGLGTERFLSGLADAFTRAGGQARPSCRAVELTRRPEGWDVIVETSRGTDVVPARSVVLCDGGFQADPDLLHRHLGTSRVRLRAADTGTGDGLRMGLAAGGVAVNMRCFYGHLLARESLTNYELWPYPILDGLAGAGALVDGRGDRLVDEGLGGVTMANHVAWSTDPLGSWVVIDEATWQAGRVGGDTPPNPHLPDHGGTLLTAPDLDALAGLAGMDALRLRRAVAEASGRPGTASAVARTRPASFTAPPFHAVPVVAGVTFTMGGLHVDGSARVLDPVGAPVPGLYAAGGTMGGLHGGPRAGYAGGLLEAAVFGLLAGNDVPGRLDQV